MLRESVRFATVLALCIVSNALEDCKKACTREFKPVCGVNDEGIFKTFSNKCVLHNAWCDDSSLRIVADGPCDEAVAPEEDDCKKMCAQVYKPVCGKNAKGEQSTFGNKCMFENAVCDDVSLVLLHEGECEMEGKNGAGDKTAPVIDEDCKKVCMAVWQPVCGMDEDGKETTYSNKCTFDNARCDDKTLVIVKEGECEGKDRYVEAIARRLTKKGSGMETTKVAGKCDFTGCSGADGPVCGSDGRTYYSSCDMASAACEDPSAKLFQVHEGSCSGEARQPEVKFAGNVDCAIHCDNRWEPVCASNGHTFRNKCHLDRDVCVAFSQPRGDKEILRFVHEGSCRSEVVAQTHPSAHTARELTEDAEKAKLAPLLSRRSKSA